MVNVMNEKQICNTATTTELQAPELGQTLRMW